VVQALVVVSFFSGIVYAGTVLLVLGRDGHVSVTKAFIATVGLPLIVSLMALLAWLVRARLARSFGEFPSLRLWLASALLRLFKGSGRRPFVNTLRTLDAARRRHGRLVAAHVAAAMSASVAAMSLGLILSAEVYHYAVEDVRFGWSTTHQLPADAMNRAVGAIALPWSWAVPAARPSAAQIEESRLSREERQRPVSNPTSRAWAWFLTFSILTYGVLLRVIVVVAALATSRRALASTRFDAPEHDALWLRMTMPLPQEAPPPAPDEPPKPRTTWQQVTGWFGFGRGKPPQNLV
jgi:hypothetical protein